MYILAFIPLVFYCYIAFINIYKKTAGTIKLDNIKYGVVNEFFKDENIF